MPPFSSTICSAKDLLKAVRVPVNKKDLPENTPSINAVDLRLLSTATPFSMSCSISVLFSGCWKKCATDAATFGPTSSKVHNCSSVQVYKS